MRKVWLTPERIAPLREAGLSYRQIAARLAREDKRFPPYTSGAVEHVMAVVRKKAAT